MKSRRQFCLIALSSMIILLTTISGANAQTLRIYHIDVEQGDATLFICPDGRALLVDSGKNGHGNRLESVMDQAGVTQVDVFVCTHYHEDHYGGIDELVHDFQVPIGEAYDRGDKDWLPSHKYNEETYVDYQAAVGEDAIHLRRGGSISVDPAVHVTCISSGGVVIGEENPQTGINENDMSISLLLTYGQFRYFIGGDIQEPSESKIADRDLVLDVDVY